MIHSTSPQISIVVEFHEEFAFILKDGENLRLKKKIKDSTDILLKDLGIWGDVQVMFTVNSRVKPFRIQVHQELLTYPFTLFGQVWEYFDIGGPGKLPVAFSPDSWLKKIFPDHEYPDSEKFYALDPDAVERVEDFFVLLIGEVIRLQPEKLAGQGQLNDFMESGKYFLPESLFHLLDQLDSDNISLILKALLGMRISVGEKKSILTEICRLLKDDKWEDEKIAEALITRLRPQQLDIEIHPVYLEQLLGDLPQENVVPVLTEQTDPKIREIFTLFSDGMFYELGIRFPEIRLVKNESLEKNAFALRLNHLLNLPHRGLGPGQLLVNEGPANLVDYGIHEATPIMNPSNNRQNSLTDISYRDKLESAGIFTWDAIGYIILVLAGEIRRRPGCLVDTESVEFELSLLEQVYPEIVSFAMDIYSGGQLAQVFRKLLSEGISIRDLRSILECLLHYDYVLTDPSRYFVFEDRLVIHHDIGHNHHPTTENLVQFVRTGLKDYISHKYTYGRWQNTLSVYLLDPALEKRIIEHLAAKNGKEGKKLFGMEEIEAVREQVRKARYSLSIDAAIPAILTIASVRPFIRDMLAVEFPDVPVLCYEELSPATEITLIEKIYLNTI